MKQWGLAMALRAFGNLPPSYLSWGSEAIGVVLYPASVVTRLLDMDCGVLGAGSMGVVTEAGLAF